MKKQLIDWINQANIADKFDEQTLLEVGNYVCEGHEADADTMKDWEELLESGMDLMKPSNEGKDYPWEKAANYKSPILYDAVRDFGDRMAVDILGKPELVATEISGESDEIKEESAERISEYHNYQINTEMKAWRTEQKSLGYRLAAQGCLFKKTFFDPALGHNVSEVIGYPDFSVNNKTTSMYDCHRFTHVKTFYPNEILERQNYGVWLDVDLMPKSDMANTNSVDNEEDCYKFLEQYCNYDLDNDGYAEPYIITVHKESQKVVRIVPRWDADGLIIKVDDSIMSLSDLRQRATQSPIGQFETSEMYINRIADAVETDVKRAKLVKIEPFKMITKYGFMDAADGSFLNYGFVHVMIGQIMGINLASNSLFNAGDLSNLQGGFLSREHRQKKRGNTVFKQGQFKQTDVPAKDLPSSILPLPSKEPSQTLLALTEQLKAETKEIGTKVNIEQMMSPNIPAASVLGVMQEGVIPTTALIGNVVDSMTAEFQIMHSLNKVYTDPEVYKMVNGPEADFESDYSMEIIIKPTANSKYSSQFQKIQLATVQMEQIPLVLQAGGNAVPIIKNYFDAIGSDLVDQVFSNEISPEEQEMNQRLLEAQEAQAQQLREQKELLQAQVQQSQQDLDRKDRELSIKAENMTLEQNRKDFETELKALELAHERKVQGAQAVKDIMEAKKIDAETQKLISEAMNKDMDGVSKILGIFVNNRES